MLGWEVLPIPHPKSPTIWLHWRKSSSYSFNPQVQTNLETYSIIQMYWCAFRPTPTLQESVWIGTHCIWAKASQWPKTNNSGFQPPRKLHAPCSMHGDSLPVGTCPIYLDDHKENNAMFSYLCIFKILGIAGKRAWIGLYLQESIWESFSVSCLLSHSFASIVCLGKTEKICM